MLTPQQKTAIAVRVLGIGKRLAPDRFPAHLDRTGQPNRELINEWAHALGTKNYPLDLWEQAVHHWVNHIDHGRMVTTGEMHKAAKAVLAKWENDPQRKAAIEAHRQAAQDERDRQIADGTFGTHRGYQPPAINPPNTNAATKFTDRLNDIFNRRHPEGDAV
ncbi:hypothetical protein [uncultured Corynebacterium sp.]|uniref:hypothetical protein n=1 Tax=uncultured Corynebacterium sp. TaxID=159447 RepID=UPI00260BD2CA|nr:hypothetical protein [uncultured Corynebacterium sp.]